MKFTIKGFVFILSVVLVAGLFMTPCGGGSAFAEEAASDEAAEYTACFVYTDDGVSAYAVTADNTKSDILIASTEPSVILAVERSSSGSVPAVAGNGFILEGTTVTITAETAGHKCQYFFSGTCSNGNILVEKNGSEDIELELQGLNLTEPDAGSCPLWIKGGSTRVTLKAKSGTSNVLTDAMHRNAFGKPIKPKACINTSGNLTICGGGELTVNGNNHAGIKSDKKIAISDGITLNISSASSAISADKELCLTSDYDGTLNINSAGKGLCCDFKKDQLPSDKSWESYDKILICGGTVNIDSADDGIHSNRDITITGGTLNIKTGDDGIHADEHVVIGTEDGTSEPKIHIPECFEGIEGMVVDIFSGDIDIISSDDGINAANPENKQTDSTGSTAIVQNNTDNVTQQDTAEQEVTVSETASTQDKDWENMPVFVDVSDDKCKINIYGGSIYVLSGKDSFDSNGNIVISGGNCVLFASSGKATMTSDALDACGTITFTTDGGTVFGASPTGRMQKTPCNDGQTYVMGVLDCEKDVTVSVEDNGTSVEYNMDCSDGFLLYTSPTYSDGAVTNMSNETTLTPKSSNEESLENAG